MSIYRLFVEGKTDIQIANAIKSAADLSLVVERKGSKDSLPSIVKNERVINKRDDIFMMRDRDFDFDVQGGANPQLVTHGDDLLGWHWCRHEIENYLIEPALVSQAIKNIEIEEFESALIEAACSIRFYVAARWSIGVAKRRTSIPPYYSLRTKPENLSDLALPEDISSLSVQGWMLGEAKRFRDLIDGVLGDKAVLDRFSFYEQQFNEQQCSNVEWVLRTFPGKDLLSGLNSWLGTKGLDAGKIKGTVLNFIVKNPSNAVSTIPEWTSLAEIWK